MSNGSLVSASYGSKESHWKMHSMLALVGAFYIFMVNKSSPWPVYLSDSIAYLVNGAILAGHNTDAMGSWHAGYSLFLVPLFLLDDPFVVWQGVLVLNAIFFGVGIYLASQLLDLLDSALDRWRHVLAVLALILYPPWTGHVAIWLSSSVMTIAVIWLAVRLVGGRYTTAADIFSLSLVCGFAYWIHPVGLVVVLGLSLFFVIIRNEIDIRYLIMFVAVSLGCISLYEFYLHEWMYDVTTPAGYSRYDHYQDGGSLQQFISFFSIWRLILYFFGHVAYSVIATFGLVLLGALYWLKVGSVFSRSMVKPGQDGGRRIQAVSIFAGSILVFSFALGSVNFLLASTWIERTDHWVYGRYSDSVVLPLLVMGFAAFLGGPDNLRHSRQRQRFAIFLVVCGLLGLGVLFHFHVDLRLAHSFLTSQGFWPQIVSVEKNFVVWMCLGAIGCLLLFLLWHSPSRIALAGLLLLFLFHSGLSGRHYLAERTSHELGYSRPSALVDVVRSGWRRGTCVGFLNPAPEGFEGVQSERYRLYAFMFFNYNYRRVTFEQWLSDCNGPLMTYDPSVVTGRSDLSLVAREEATGIYLVARRSSVVLKPVVTKSGPALGPIILASDFGEACVLAGCYSLSATKLGIFSQTGRLDGQQFLTEGKTGYLFFGPYRRLEAGQYVLRLAVQTRNVTEAFVEIVSAEGVVIHAKQPLLNIVRSDGRDALLTFSLEHAVQDLQVRLYVTEKDDLVILGYSVRLL